MSRDFHAEIDQFVALAFQPLKPGEMITARVQAAFTELCDIVGAIVDGIDPENRAAELPALSEAIELRISRMVQGLNLGIYGRTLVLSSLPIMIPLVVAAAADKSSVIVKARDEYALPAFDFAIRSLVRVRSGLFPDAAPLSLSPEVSDENRRDESSAAGGEEGGRQIARPSGQG